MNVIWIVADTFRKDHLGCYGNPKLRTPSLDALAAQSVRFNRHYAADFPTMPNRADFLTGRWTGCFMRWQPLPWEQVRSVLPAIIAREGIHTAAVVEEMERVTHCPGLGRAAVTYDQAQLPMPERWGYIEEDGLFLKAIAGEIPPTVSAEDGYRAVELVEACYQSTRTGQPVRLPL